MGNHGIASRRESRWTSARAAASSWRAGLILSFSLPYPAQLTFFPISSFSIEYGDWANHCFRLVFRLAHRVIPRTGIVNTTCFIGEVSSPLQAEGELTRRMFGYDL